MISDGLEDGMRGQKRFVSTSLHLIIDHILAWARTCMLLLLLQHIHTSTLTLISLALNAIHSLQWSCILEQWVRSCQLNHCFSNSSPPSPHSFSIPAARLQLRVSC